MGTVWKSGTPVLSRRRGECGVCPPARGQLGTEKKATHQKKGAHLSKKEKKNGAPGGAHGRAVVRGTDGPRVLRPGGAHRSVRDGRRALVRAARLLVGRGPLPRLPPAETLEGKRLRLEVLRLEYRRTNTRRRRDATHDERRVLLDGPRQGALHGNAVHFLFFLFSSHFYFFL